MIDPGSFRDPSGHIFYKKNKVYRVVNNSYKKHYDHLMNSGLYDALIEENLLVSHIDTFDNKLDNNQYKILELDKIPFISYPYEWSFNQFKDSVLLTLKMQLVCIKFGMTLKDATPFNVQFKNNKPIFIDTLSFEYTDEENYVWKPYKQFCEMFLGPLCLMSYRDPTLNKLLINYINGVPLKLINELLPFKSKFNLSIFSHLVLHNLIKEGGAKKIKNKKPLIISKSKHLNIINQLISFVENIKLPGFGSEWGEYNEETVIEKKGYVVNKKNTINSFLNSKKYDLIWDVGSNDGLFSRIIAESYCSKDLISFDIDWRCVNKNYLICKKNNITNIFPVVFDLSNPTPSVGWMNRERSSVFERFGTPDLICCFAIIHHIINVGIPIEKFMDFLSKSSKDVLIEYVPFSDPKCKIIFESRDENFQYPSENDFVKVLEQEFKIIKSHKLSETDRILYLLSKNEKFTQK